MPETDFFYNSPMKLVVIEDQTIIREAICQACQRDFGHEVVGEADCSAEGLRLVLTLCPDVVILDLGLPDFSGLIVAERVRELRPATRILVVSGYVDDATVYRMEKIGVQGFVDKNVTDTATLRRALIALSEGRTWFSPSYETIRHARALDPRAFTKVLSDMELRVLAEIGEGLTDQEVAARLGITYTTVQTHRTHILRKLAIGSTPKLVAYAIKHGFTVPGPAAACVMLEH